MGVKKSRFATSIDSIALFLVQDDKFRPISGGSTEH